MLPSPGESQDSSLDDDEQTWLKNIRPFTPLVGQRSFGRPCTPDTIEEGRPFTPSSAHFDAGGLAAMESALEVDWRMLPDSAKLAHIRKAR